MACVVKIRLHFVLNWPDAGDDEPIERRSVIGAGRKGARDTYKVRGSLIESFLRKSWNVSLYAGATNRTVCEECQSLLSVVAPGFERYARGDQAVDEKSNTTLPGGFIMSTHAAERKNHHQNPIA